MSSDKLTKSNSRKAIKYRGAECLNCGTPLELTDKYCSYCGQLNTTKQLSLSDFFGEFIGSIVTYDSRFRYTIKDLLIKPGTITRDYSGGKRLKYANPFRFFLSVSIIYFLLSGLIDTITGQSNFVNQETGENKQMNFDTSPDNFKLMVENQDSIQEKLRDELGKDPVTKKFTEEMFVVMDTVREAISRQDSIERVRKKIIDSIGYEYFSEAQLDTMSWGNAAVKRVKLYYDYYHSQEVENPKAALDSLGHDNTTVNRWIYSKNDAVDRIQKNPGGFVNFLLEKVPFFLFFFTPIFAAFFWLIYSKKKFTYMEHMIFIFHIFSFVFLAMLICLIPDTIIGEDVVATLVIGLIGPFYFYKALRNFYRESRLITIIKFVFLNWVFWIGATVASTLFFLVMSATY